MVLTWIFWSRGIDMYLWSPSRKGFYPLSEQSRFELLGVWPEDGVEITESEHAAFFLELQPGKIIGTLNDRPAWIDPPPPSREELIATIEVARKQLLQDADNIIEDWRTELALDEISDANKAKLSAWMAYKRQVKSVLADDALMPGFKWPQTPA